MQKAAPYARQVGLLVRNHRVLHGKFVSHAKRGPELHFHVRCLQFWKNMKSGAVSLPHAESLYAVLTAWGMNSRNACLVPFEVFWQALRKNRSLIRELRGTRLLGATAQQWAQLKTLWDRLVVCDPSSDYQLVGRSKALAHLMPDWIAPIDRAHTLEFLRTHTSIPRNKNAQWNLFRDIHLSLFLPVARGIGVQLQARVDNASAFGWDSSIPKAIDNLIWAAPKNKKNRQNP